MKKTLLSIGFLFLLIAIPNSCSKKGSGMEPKKGLERLIEGNKRFVSGASQHPNRSKERREAISEKQSPFAVVVSCSDSRVSPKIIFDEGLGDLFVVRVAGNVIGPLELDSINFSALQLGSSIILVLGHESCGAVSAVLDDQTADIPSVAKLIEPAVKEAEKSGDKPLLEHAIKNNALNMRNLLRESPKIAELIKEGKIDVLAGYYSFKTGEVQILSIK